LAGQVASRQDRRVTESQSPLDAALDLLLYVPVGVALTAAEEIPKLAAKGRAQLEGQVTMARVVGQFAVAQGRKELQKRLNSTLAPRPDAGGDSGPGAPASASRGDVAGAPRAWGAAADPESEPGQVGSPIDPDPTRGLGSDNADGEGTAWMRPPGQGDVEARRPAAGSLAIPGYDSLAASQVVQRLAGLSKDELDEVGAYEASHRSRRTILSRIRQLQGS
jgi:hypothetical protein